MTKTFRVNAELLPLKFHYLFFFGGLAGVLPYLITYLQDLGASASVIGIVYSVLPFIVQLSKPLIGGISDRHQCHKQILTICLIVTLISFYAIIFTPEAKSKTKSSILTAQCNVSGVFPDFCQAYSEEDNSETLSVNNSNCQLSCSYNNSTLLISDRVNVSKVDPNEGGFCCNRISWSGGVAFSCLRQPTDLTCSWKCNPEICTFQNGDTSTAVDPVQLTYISICMAVSWIAYTAVNSLGDAITLDLLDTKKGNFGKSRLFGTIGWGLFSIVAGYAIDWTNEGKEGGQNISAGFYIMAVLLLLDLIAVQAIKDIKHEKPQNLTTDVISAFKSVDVVVFTISVFVIGCFSGILWTFLIMFMHHLGSSSLLIGLALGVQCFGGELIFFFISGWFLEKFGYNHSITMVMAAFSTRFMWYSFVTDPYWILPVEITQGFCYGIFFSALATYASTVANPCVAATMQGVFQGTFEGLGVGVGTLVGGFIYDTYGGHTMWRILGIFAAICTLLHFIAQMVLSRYKGHRSPAQLASNDKVYQPEDDCLNMETKLPQVGVTNQYGSVSSNSE